MDRTLLYSEPTSWDDARLLQAIGCHSDQALETFIHRYYPLAYATTYRLVQNHSIAEDLVQEIFVTIWKKGHTYQAHVGSVRTWFLALTRYRVIDWLRWKAAQKDTVLPTEGEDYLSNDRDLWEVAWAHHRQGVVQSVLAGLPAAQRQAIFLNFFVGYSHNEIARREHISLGTVKGRIRQGLRKMRSLLSAQGITEAE